MDVTQEQLYLISILVTAQDALKIKRKKVLATDELVVGRPYYVECITDFGDKTGYFVIGGNIDRENILGVITDPFVAVRED